MEESLGGGYTIDNRAIFGYTKQSVRSGLENYLFLTLTTHTVWVETWGLGSSNLSNSLVPKLWLSLLTKKHVNKCWCGARKQGYFICLLLVCILLYRTVQPKWWQVMCIMVLILMSVSMVMP